MTLTARFCYRPRKSPQTRTKARMTTIGTMETATLAPPAADSTGEHVRALFRPRARRLNRSLAFVVRKEEFWIACDKCDIWFCGKCAKVFTRSALNTSNSS
jgi:hypothetical protein